MTYQFDPELALVVPTLPDSSFVDPIAARRFMEELVAALNTGVDTTGLDVDDRRIPGPDGAPDVAVRVYRPLGTQGPQPAILYIHGGGFVVGTVQAEHASSAGLASGLGAVVVSVEYRLAPEHPFPDGLEDCYAALNWLHGHAGELGVDTGRVAVFGQSAGGGLSAALALLARDRGGPPLCFQFLGIPELDDRLDTPSMQAFVDTPLWNRPNAVLSWQYYLGDAPGEVSPYAAPARAANLSGLPPAYVSTMQFDPLRDEGILYALRLLQAGVPVELHQYPGTFHGSGLVASAAVSKRASTEAMEVMRRALDL